jgi:hypothetical protein
MTHLDVIKQINDLKKQIKLSQQKLSALEKEYETIAFYNNTHPSISDHALVRYLERVKKFDFTEFRKEMLTSDRYEAIKMGATKIKIDNITFVVNDGVIVTCLD